MVRVERVNRIVHRGRVQNVVCALSPNRDIRQAENLSDDRAVNRQRKLTVKSLDAPQCSSAVAIIRVPLCRPGCSTSPTYREALFYIDHARWSRAVCYHDLASRKGCPPGAKSLELRILPISLYSGIFCGGSATKSLGVNDQGRGRGGRGVPPSYYLDYKLSSEIASFRIITKTMCSQSPTGEPSLY